MYIYTHYVLHDILYEYILLYHSKIFNKRSQDTIDVHSRGDVLPLEQAQPGRATICMLGTKL